MTIAQQPAEDYRGKMSTLVRTARGCAGILSSPFLHLPPAGAAAAAAACYISRLSAFILVPCLLIAAARFGRHYFAPSRFSRGALLFFFSKFPAS